jgi:anti-sigma factor ChrR (cupin superfamily)
MKDELEETALLADWAQRLEASLQHPAREASLRGGVLARVAASAQAHAQYLTVRRERGAWVYGGPGVEICALRADGAFRVELLRLASGVTVPPAADAAGQELLVLEGELFDAAANRVLPPCSYAVMDASPDAPGVSARGPALLYRRVLRADAADLLPPERAWWSQSMPGAAAGWNLPGDWTASSPGVQVMPLRAHRHVVSMLVRFEAGASVPDHGHELDEDCLVLQGEMFLGDILLRAGDYQLAPAGGGHFGETSDVGVVFFFHGALDANLRGKRRH